MPPEQDARQAILDATRALVSEVEDLEKITVRLIAERAGVGTGLVNYHFASKDNLLGIVIGNVMATTIREAAAQQGGPPDAPVSRLRALLKELCALASSSEQLMRFILSREVLGGTLETGLHLVPLLREIYGDREDETRLRILALQILHPIQVAGLNATAFHLYSGIDLTRPEQRDRFVDALIDNLITPVAEGPRP